MALYEGLDDFALAQEFVPVNHVEFEGIPLAFIPVTSAATAQVPSVVMKRQPVNRLQLMRTFPQNFFQKAASPIPIVVVGAGGDKRKFRSEVRNPGGKAAELGGIFLWSEISSASPGLVAHAPIANSERLGISCTGPHVCQRRTAGGRVAVFHPASEALGGQAAQIRRQIRLAPDEFAKMDKFIRPELIGIVFMSGRRFLGFDVLPKVSTARALVGWTDSISPVIAVGETSSGKANDRSFNLAHLVDQVFADSIDVGDGRVLSDPDPVVDHAA